MTVKLKHSMDGFIGKVVSGIVVAEYSDGNPINRIFMIFSDGTALETWQDNDMLYMSDAHDFYSVDKAIEILERRKGGKVRVFRPRHEDPANPQRNLLNDWSWL